jgi:hypothetical protein
MRFFANVRGTFHKYGDRFVRGHAIVPDLKSVVALAQLLTHDAAARVLRMFSTSRSLSGDTTLPLFMMEALIMPDVVKVLRKYAIVEAVSKSA